MTPLPNITKQQHAILILIYRYRFLNSIQIQHFLRHKDRHRINAWLLNLTENGYLKRIYSTNFGENTKPAIYYIGLNGIRCLKTVETCTPEVVRKLYREESKSPAFARQCQALADAALSFQDADDNAPDGVAYVTETQSDMAAESSDLHFLIEELRPSLALVTKRKKKSKVYLLELFEPTLPNYSMRKRIRDYISFCEDGVWEDYFDDPFPTVLLVCPDLPRLISLKRYAKRLKEEDELPEELVLWFATEDQVRKTGVCSEIWELVLQSDA